MALTFRVEIVCVCHAHPRVINELSMRSMAAVLAFFDDFGNAYHGTRCMFHSSLTLIPRLAGWEVC